MNGMTFSPGQPYGEARRRRRNHEHREFAAARDTGMLVLVRGTGLAVSNFLDDLTDGPNTTFGAPENLTTRQDVDTRFYILGSFRRAREVLAKHNKLGQLDGSFAGHPATTGGVV